MIRYFKVYILSTLTQLEQDKVSNLQHFYTEAHE